MASERKGTKIERGYRLLAALLSGGQLDRRAVAQLLGVKEAAADTHIKRLVALEIPGIRVERKGQKKVVSWRVGAASGAVSGAASRSLVIAACFGASVAQLFRGTAYETLLQEVKEGLIARLRKSDGFEDTRRKFLLISQAGELALDDRHGILDELIEAVLQQRCVELQYTSFEGHERRETISPWSIAIYDHQLYVLAVKGGSSPRPYRISRIRKAKILPAKFKYPLSAAYDPERLFRDSFGIFIGGEGATETVDLRFTPRWTTYAHSHLWHSTHQVLSEGDAGVVVRMNVRICNEFRAFILSFGSEVEVLAPDSLRTSIAASAAAAAAVYSPTVKEKMGRRRVAARKTDKNNEKPATSPGRVKKRNRPTPHRKR